MTREDIIRLALDAGLLNYVDNETPRRYFIHGHADLEELERFAALVAAAEREECAKVCDEIEKSNMNKQIKELLSQAGVHYEVMPKDTVYEKFAELIVKVSARDCAAAIRDRGETNDIA